MLGHQDASTTLWHSASLFPDAFDDIAGRMDIAIKRVLTPDTDDDSE